jgi:hypothetical protein
MSIFIYLVFVLLGSDLGTGCSLVQGVLPDVLDLETEVKRRVSRIPYAPSGSNRKKPTTNHTSNYSVFTPRTKTQATLFRMNNI